MLKQATLQRLWCRRTCWWHSNSTALASCSSCLRTAGMPPIQALALALPHTSRANWGACRCTEEEETGTTREWQDPPVEVRILGVCHRQEHLSSSCHPTWISRAVPGYPVIRSLKWAAKSLAFSEGFSSPSRLAPCKNHSRKLQKDKRCRGRISINSNVKGPPGIHGTQLWCVNCVAALERSKSPDRLPGRPTFPEFPTVRLQSGIYLALYER